MFGIILADGTVTVVKSVIDITAVAEELRGA